MSITRPVTHPLTRPLPRPIRAPGTGGGGSSPAFSPLDLFSGGLQGGWWDISDLSTLFQNSNGTTAAAIGDPVGYVADKSGNTRHMIQATGAARPVLRQDGDGAYYLEFDGVDDTLAVASSTTMFNFMHNGLGGTAYHGLSVGSDSANTNTLGTSVNNAQDGFRFTRVAASDSANVIVRNTALGNVINMTGTANAWPITDKIILGFTYLTQAGDDAHMYLDGVLQASGAEAFTPSMLDSGRTLGMPMTLTLAANWYGGLVIAKELTAQERGDFEAWLADKMEVTL